MKTLFPFLVGKFSNMAIKEFGLGSGSTWPGHIALRINPQFIRQFLLNKNIKIILVVGTNGKTTTSKLLAHMLENNGIHVFQNTEGANMINGLATTFVRNTNLFGKIKGDVAIFEVDENNLPKVLDQITPAAIVFLNLFRDQLDRYGEIHTIAEKWRKALKNVPKSTHIFLNADDPEIRNLVKDVAGKTFYYSIPDTYFKKSKIAQDTDSSHCPQCGTPLTFAKIAYSHLGKYTCKKCTYSNENIALTTDDIKTPSLVGTYNIYNVHAAVKTAKEIFNLSTDEITAALKNFIPAFGRQEIISYKKRTILMLLAKNPAGFNQSLSVVTPDATVLLALNDQIPDGRDVSWIWDIDIETIPDSTKKIIITGDRAYDMGLRLKYTSEIRNQPFKMQDKIHIEVSTKKALDALVKNTREGETAYILPTYSAMLEIRKLLTGKEIL
jgi:UDP-N-acetylmuramyl tripeptide synthase